MEAPPKPPKLPKVQEEARLAANETEVRGALDQIWDEPAKVDEVLSGLMDRNKKLYEFERMLEES